MFTGRFGMAARDRFRWADGIFTGWTAGGVSEAELQKAVLEPAQRLGWRTAHFRPGMTKAGNWVTAVQGDGKGFPDLFMVKAGMAPYAVELKATKGRLSVEQREWLDALDEAGCHAVVWRPEDWLSGRIERELRAGEARAAA